MKEMGEELKKAKEALRDAEMQVSQMRTEMSFSFNSF